MLFRSNDSYNASPMSVKSALHTFVAIAEKNRKIAILGDMLELGEMTDYYHEKIGKIVADSSIDILVTLGDGGKVIAQSALTNGMQENCIFSFRRNDRKKLSQKLLDILKPKDFLLLKASREIEMEKVLEYLQEEYKNRIEGRKWLIGN